MLAATRMDDNLTLQTSIERNSHLSRISRRQHYAHGSRDSDYTTVLHLDVHHDIAAAKTFVAVHHYHIPFRQVNRSCQVSFDSVLLHHNRVASTTMPQPGVGCLFGQRAPPNALPAEWAARISPLMTPLPTPFPSFEAWCATRYQRRRMGKCQRTLTIGALSGRQLIEVTYSLFCLASCPALPMIEIYLQLQSSAR